MTPVLGIIASSNQQGRGGVVGSYDALATVTLSATTASVTFAGIPTGYRHLQIRMIARTARSVVGTNLTYRFNNDTTNSNYAWHYLTGDGASAAAGAQAPSAGAPYILKCSSANASASVFGVGVWDILDYANTSKNKTSKALSGYDNNGSGEIVLFSSAWFSTAVVNTITITDVLGDNLVANTQFALYGVK